MDTFLVNNCLVFYYFTGATTMETVSSIQVLSFNSSGLNDAFFTSFEKCCKGKLLSLVEIDLTANENLTAACIECLANLTSGKYRVSHNI